MRFAVLLLSAVFLMNIAAAQTGNQAEQADAIFVNGDVLPGVDTILNVSEPPAGHNSMSWARERPRVQAIAVRGDRILAIGTNDEIRKLAGKQTRVVDLGGHFVMPGFNDAHLHLSSGGFEKLNVNLTGTKSLEEMKARIAERVSSIPKGEWLQGRGWDHTVWPEKKLPTRQDLDAVTGDHPAVFVRVDGHIAVANSAALKAAGISKTTSDPPGGKIDRDANGDPTGILRESAKEELMAKIPPPTPSQRRRAIELALQDAASHGVTSMQDNSEWDDFLTYQELEAEGKLTARITEWLPFDASVNMLQLHRAEHPQKDPMLHTGMLKGFMDGSLGSRTAAMLAPYSDDPSNTGLPQYTQAKLNQMADQRVSARFQMGFHAIGDRAVEMALNAFETAERYAREHDVSGLGATPQRHDFRFRVEHAQVLAPDQFERFHKLHVIASMQPNHLLTDMNWAMERLGPARAKYSYAWKRFLDDDVPLAFGTDYPVEPITPFRGLYAAVTRQNEAGTRSYFPEEKISMAQAIAAYTVGAAYAEFAEKDKGTLSRGMLADFVVLDRDLTKVTPHEILGTKVLMTIVGGKPVYEAPQGPKTSSQE